MKRRTFIKGTTLLATAVLTNSTILFANENNGSFFRIKNGVRKFTIKNSYEIKKGDGDVQVWIPIPLDSTYQTLANINYSGNYKTAKIVKNEYNTKVLYALWSKTNKTNNLEVTFDVVTNQTSLDLSRAKDDTNYSKDVKLFLEPTAHIPVSDKLKAYAKNITKDKKSPIEKARAIYDWTVETMYRDNSIVGCGIGDAKRALEESLFGGKCTDISSVFVCLLRNADIPAREVFGIRAGKSKISKACGKADEKGFANITGGQHCRAEFFVSGLGWVPADPADVTKVRLAEKLDKTSIKLKEVQEFMFGSWEMNWVAFNYARDFVLNPKPTQYPLNMLGYPYAEVGEDAQDYYAPKTFAYTYTSQERV